MHKKLWTGVWIGLLGLVATNVFAHNLRSLDEQHTEVSLRMIGHELLLAAGDSISRVMPVIKEENQYRIQFSNELAFVPDDLIGIANRVVSETQLGNAYIVEVQECESNAVVYSYEMMDLTGENLIPCRGRALPKGCYEVVLSIEAPPVPPKVMQIEEKGSKSWMWLLSVLMVFAVWMVRRFMLQKKASNSSLIPLGDYQFDSVRTVLVNGGDQIELTSKESDLLQLLYQSTNETVERDIILQRVWGDNGDYVGRTLDVFISKLRKKLEGNPRVKIVNVRGVGYKMVIS